jgi:uncharacterized YccA/Bax inhibitor family protein
MPHAAYSGAPARIIWSPASKSMSKLNAAKPLIRAGAPEKAAWGIALGLTVTLVWLYLEILRLLSYLQND